MRHASDCDANASFSSTKSTSAQDLPARASALFAASMGAMGKSSGSTPCAARPATRARGSEESAPSPPSSTAEAPSLIDDELPAVTVPSPGGANSALSPASFSTVLPSRIPSSRASSAPGTCTISASYLPAAHASAARRCERTANSS